MSALVRPIYTREDIPKRGDETEKDFFSVLESPNFKRVIAFGIFNKIRQSKKAQTTEEKVGYLNQIQCLQEILDSPEVLVQDVVTEVPTNEDETLQELNRI
jgi:hypothetical protein